MCAFEKSLCHSASVFPSVKWGIITLYPTGLFEADLIFVIEGPQMENALTGPSIIALIVIISNNIIILLIKNITSNEPSHGVQQADHLGIFFP